jgi:hypothetical protein
MPQKLPLLLLYHVFRQEFIINNNFNFARRKLTNKVTAFGNSPFIHTGAA